MRIKIFDIVRICNQSDLYPRFAYRYQKEFDLEDFVISTSSVYILWYVLAYVCSKKEAGKTFITAMQC